MRRRTYAVFFTTAMVFGALVGSPAHGATEPSGELFGSTIAGEVDGVIGDEIVTVHAIESDSPSLDGLVEVVLRRGSDGTPLWSKTVPAGSHTVVPARVGPNGVKGMYLIVRRHNYFVEIHSTENGVSIMNPLPLLYGNNESGYDIYALTATGEPLWERHVTAAYDMDNPGRAVDAPLAIGSLRATPSSATDMVLLLADSPAVIVEQNRNETSVRAVVLDGADGAETSTAMVPNAPYGIADLAIADLDADGLQDYVAALPTKGVYAHKGVDSTALWSSLGDFSEISTVADVTSDGIRDVLARRIEFNPSQATPGDVRLIGGRTGATRFDVLADEAWRASDGIGTATKVITSSEAGVEFDLYDANGIGRRHRDALAPRAAGVNTTVDVDSLLGDLNGDGAADLSYTVSSTLNGATTTKTVVTDGNTFAPLWSDRPVGEALFDGRGTGGDDLVLVQPFGQYAREIVLQDGATGVEQWLSRLVPDSDVTDTVIARAGDLNGDGAMDLLVELSGRKKAAVGTVPDDLGTHQDRVTHLYALNGATGAVRWTR